MSVFICFQVFFNKCFKNLESNDIKGNIGTRWIKLIELLILVTYNLVLTEGELPHPKEFTETDFWNSLAKTLIYATRQGHRLSSDRYCV